MPYFKQLPALKLLRIRHGLPLLDLALVRRPFECNESELAALLQQLGRLSLLSWQEVQLAPRHGLGSEKIARTSIAAPIPPAVTEDVKFFLSLRFQGKKPFVGFRNGYVFHVLWIENRFRVYAH